MQHSRIRVAVFNGEAVKALPVVRALGRAGISARVYSFEHLAPAGVSRYSKSNLYLRVCDPGEVIKHLRRQRISTVLPLEDSSIAFFLAHAELFSEFNLVIPGKEAFELFNDKAKTAVFAREHGIVAPQTWIPDSVAEAKQIFENAAAFPLVIKPRVSSGSRGLKVVDTPDEGCFWYQKIQRRYPLPIIQQFIPQGGRALGAEFLFFQGREIMSFAHQRIRQFPVKGGPSTYCRTCTDQRVIEAGRRILLNANFSGLAMVEFLEDPEGHELYLMEVNPRAWGSISLPISCGFNFPVKAVEVFGGIGVAKRCPAPGKDVENLRMRWLIPADIMSILGDRRLGFAAKVRELFRSYPDTVYQIMDRKDPLPVLVWILKMTLSAFNPRFLFKNLWRR